MSIESVKISNVGRKVDKVNEKLDRLLALREEELSLSDDLKRSISVDIVRHVLHELEYGRNKTAGKDPASLRMKAMFKIWESLDYKDRDEIIQEWIDWGTSAINSRGL